MAIITGTSGNNNLTGTSGDDEIWGLAGNDVIDGGAGDDLIDGGPSVDTLKGGAGNDTLWDIGSGSAQGGDGADQFVFSLLEVGETYVADGGNDNDYFTFSLVGDTRATLKGGAGSDVVSIGRMLGSLDVSLGSSRDKFELLGGYLDQYGNKTIRSGGISVSDFGTGSGGDVIDWDVFLVRTLVGWNQSANPFSNGYLRLRQAGKDTLVQFDPNGGGDGYLTLMTLKNVSKGALTAPNFDGYDPSGAKANGRTIDGSDQFDELKGTMGDDVIRAFGGDDLVYASGGADTVHGGAGWDTLSGEVGHDSLHGEEGDDVLAGGAGNDKLDGGLGNDDLYGELGDDLLSGGDGNDYLYAGEGNDVLLGGDGNDLLQKQDDGSARLEGGSGDDRFEVSSYSYASDHLILLGGGGNDTFDIGIPSQDTTFVDAGSGNDRITISGAGGGTRILTGSGTDTIIFTGLQAGWPWNLVLEDFVAGPEGDRLNWEDFLANGLLGWNGRDNPFAAGYLRLAQSETSTLLQIDADADDFNHGFQTLAVFAGTLSSDLTTENLGGYSPIPVKNGTSGSNTIKGTDVAERLNGLAGSDRLFGYAGEDLLVGGSSDDHLDGGVGADRLYGGTGDDIFIVNSGSDRVFELAGQGIDRVESSATFTLSDNVENLFLKGVGSISGTGNASDNIIVGNSVVNRLYGNGGNDMLNGGAGADFMKGGPGDDRFIVDAIGDVVAEDNRAGTDTIETSVDYQLPVQVERLVLAGSSPLEGRGNSSDNWIYGNSGDNFLSGGRGNDRIEGGAGHDRIYGSYGKDVLVGGSGKDRFYFNVEPAAENADRILDFSPRDDTIYLAQYAFDGLPSLGKLRASAFRNGTSATDSNDRIVYDSSSGNIFYDVDGSGATTAVLIATVNPGTAITYADFDFYG